MAKQKPVVTEPITRAYRITILGKPCSQKNNKQIVRTRRVEIRKKVRPFMLVDSPDVARWKKKAFPQVRAHWGSRLPLDGDMAVIVKIFMGKLQRGDTDNYTAAPLDALEKARVIINDQRFSDVVGMRRRDWENPRYEIIIMPADWLTIGIDAPGKTEVDHG